MRVVTFLIFILTSCCLAKEVEITFSDQNFKLENAFVRDSVVTLIGGSYTTPIRDRYLIFDGEKHLVFSVVSSDFMTVDGKIDLGAGKPRLKLKLRFEEPIEAKKFFKSLPKKDYLLK